MRKIHLIILIVVFCGINVSSQNTKLKEVPSKLKKILSGMKFFDDATFTMGRHSEFKPTESDSTLIAWLSPYRKFVSSFYISDHEVTNSEYKEFVSWVETSVKEKKKKSDPGYSLLSALNPSEYVYEYTIANKIYTINIYPDTACWTREFKYAYNEPMAAQYFQNKAYANYPVVGITYFQAEAYCYWKTQMLNTLIKKLFGESTTIKAQFRLPLEEEWEYAAIPAYKETESFISLYPWDDFGFRNGKGLYKANFGPVEDANGVSVKSFIDDNAFHTAAVKQYNPNSRNIYDMAGNVAEWTSTPSINTGVPTGLGDTIFFKHTDGYTTGYSKAYQLMHAWNKTSIQRDTNEIKIRVTNMAFANIHDAQVIHRYSPGRIVKGGSWFSSLIYLQPGTKEVWYEKRGSCRIGFRVAMELWQ